MMYVMCLALCSTHSNYSVKNRYRELGKSVVGACRQQRARQRVENKHVDSGYTLKDMALDRRTQVADQEHRKAEQGMEGLAIQAGRQTANGTPRG